MKQQNRDSLGTAAMILIILAVMVFGGFRCNGWGDDVFPYDPLTLKHRLDDHEARIKKLEQPRVIR